MTHPLVRQFRYPALLAAVTVCLCALAASTLDAPGPPGVYIEPQTGMVLVAVEPGHFTMGSPEGEAGRQADEQARVVTIDRRIYMGRFEVTQTEWAMVMRDDPSGHAGCGRCPVEQVDFFQVDEFITALNAQSTSMRYRLPTEAEWEYACRAGATTPFAWGSSLTRALANVDVRYPYPGDPVAEPYGETRPVGSFPANAWGFFDMHGNVWEWTNDWYGPYDPSATVNPTGAKAGTARVIRGGSWRFDANSARCALRYTHAPQDKGPSLGFRIVAEPIRRRAGGPSYLNR